MCDLIEQVKSLNVGPSTMCGIPILVIYKRINYEYINYDTVFSSSQLNIVCMLILPLELDDINHIHLHACCK